MKEGGPDKSRRWILHGLAAAAAAGVVSRMVPKQDAQQVPPDTVPDEPDPEAVPDEVEEILQPREFGMRSVLEDQLKRSEKPHFGQREHLEVNLSWRNRMKKSPHIDNLIAANARLRGKIDLSSDETHLDRIKKIFAEEKVPAKWLCIAISESWYRSHNEKDEILRSPTGAKGPFQFQQDTAEEYGLVESDDDGKIIYDYRADPFKSARAAAQYLKKFKNLFTQCNAPDGEAEQLSVCSYNGGCAQRYLKAIRKAKLPASMPGFREFVTQEMQQTFAAAMVDDTRPVEPGENLRSLSRKYGVSQRVIKRRNPNVNWKNLIANKTQITVPGIKTAPLFEQAKKNDTLASIAHRLRVPEHMLMEKNPDIKWERLSARAQIDIPEKSPLFGNYVLARKLFFLRGYIENIDYLAKTEAIIYAMDNYDLTLRIPLPRRNPRIDIEG